MSEFATKYRTHTCGEPRLEHVPPPPVPGKKEEGEKEKKEAPGVTLAGFVDEKVDEKTILLRDRYGKTQVTVAPDALPYVAEAFQKFNLEDVIQVGGDIAARGDDEKDRSLPTGEVRLLAKKVEVLSIAEPVPEGVLTDEEVPLERRLAFRQLYLRRDDAKKRLEFRSRVAHACREVLVENGFVEIQTPDLFWYDPVATGGEIVPDVKNKAWRLPSGPVVLNQFIKGGGIDRFFQILRVTRREPNPGPFHAMEHTALDINMAHVDMPDFLRAVEAMLSHVWKTVLGAELKTPFKTFKYREALLKYGTDKVDARFGLEIQDVKAGSGTVRALRVPGGAALLKDDPDLAGIAKDAAAAAERAVSSWNGPAAAVSWARVAAGGKVEGAAAKLLGADAQKALGAAEGDLLVASTSEAMEAAAAAAGAARLAIGRKLSLVPEGRHEPVWVTEYPIMKKEGSGLVPDVVVFTLPTEETGALVFGKEDRDKVIGRAFDLVVDGVEVASGYIGNHNLVVNRAIWENMMLMNLGDLFRVRAPVESHRFGVTPHGGMNMGFDRLIAVLLDAPSLDEVMWFPKDHACKDWLLNAPGPIPEEAMEGLVPTAPRPTTIEAELGEEVAKYL